MNKSDILELLCYYDERNIIYGAIIENDGKELIENHKKFMNDVSQCYCNNCLTGRSKLAEYILKSNNLLESAADELQDFEENGYNNNTAMKIYKHLNID